LIRWTVTGIPKRDFLGVSASDKPITVSGFDLFRISEDGKKLAEMWQQWNIGSWP
jgi:SnoaL-like polyketide cyclase